MAGNTKIAMIYLIFLFPEQTSFRKKLVALVTDENDRQQIEKMLRKIDGDTRLYLGIKIFTSALTALLGYVIMRLIGVDFAEFWAIMLFGLNLSLLAIILSLALWGSIGGVAGMRLCVPIILIAMIILSHFDSTRPIAVLLSRNGEYLTPRAEKSR